MALDVALPDLHQGDRHIATQIFRPLRVDQVVDQQIQCLGKSAETQDGQDRSCCERWGDRVKESECNRAVHRGPCR